MLVLLQFKIKTNKQIFETFKMVDVDSSKEILKEVPIATNDINQHLMRQSYDSDVIEQMQNASLISYSPQCNTANFQAKKVQI